MTRMAGFPGGVGRRGDDSHGRLTQAGEDADGMENMQMGDMPGMDMPNMKMGPEAQAISSDPSVPSASLGAGKQATTPDGPLANTQLDAGMMGMTKEQQSATPHLSDLQRRNLDAFDMSSDSMRAQRSETAPDANNVPNFPQDAYMEGTMMNMEKLVEKPENLGLRPNWSRFMQGMMTFLRVLPSEQYEEVVSAMRKANRPSDPYVSLYTVSQPNARG